MRLTEDWTKTWLRECGIAVPQGAVASTAEEAGDLAGQLGGAVAVKALVPTGRRGKAGAVLLVSDPAMAAEAAKELLGSQVAGYPVSRLYLEQQAKISREFYLSFTFGARAPCVMVSRHGGVEIETVHAEHPEAIVQSDIDPLRGLRPWDAMLLWERSGVEGAVLPGLARLSVELYEAFRRGDGAMLELNPIAWEGEGQLQVVGAMLEVDDNALFRHPQWERLFSEDGGGQEQLTPRERYVMEANKRYPGGAARYTELDGDIGLMVAGGGAGLLQHDMIIAAGGRPANHTDISPGPTQEKIRSLLEAIFDHPRTRSLLIGYNYLQMAPCDFIVQALLEAIASRGIDPHRFPIVLRIFGPKEEEARALAATIPGIHYMPTETSLEEAVRRVVELTARVKGEGAP